MIADTVRRILEGRILPGDQIGHFQLIEYAGGGGMGRVFRAIDLQLDRTVALKILPPEQAADPDSLQRFRNEAQSAARLDHDNVVRAYYAGEECGLHYIVFEFVEGLNLRTLVERKGPLPLAEAVNYSLQIAEALVHANARAVVHRDIKPSNVLVTSEGRVKLIDLGLARLQLVDTKNGDLTASGVTLGTFDYISPEQARDPRNADVRSDIYSFGCTLFFMLTGQPPFPQGTVLQKLLQHQGDEPPDVRSLRPDLSDDTGRILRKMMAKDPRHRYADPTALVADLTILADRIGLRPLTSAGRTWLNPAMRSRSHFERHLPWILPTVALVTIVLLMNMLWPALTPHEDIAPPPFGVPTPIAMPSAASKPIIPALAQSSGDVPRGKSPQATAAANAHASPGQKDTPLTGLSKNTAIPDRSPSANPPTDKNADSSRPDPSRSNVLVVRDNPTEQNEFSTLGGACAAAHDGDVVELRFNGLREERPMKLSNLQITVRPAEGYRPTIVFRPNEINPVTYPRSMLTLSSGRLTLIDVSMEMHVPREFPAENWSLIETWGGQAVHLERCVLTIRNASDQLTAYHPEAAFVRARPSPDGMLAAENGAAATPLATIELVDCIVRGEADFLCVEELQPVYLLWDNGLLATSDRFLVAQGGPAASKPDEMLRLELRHVTAVVRGGLCHLSNTLAAPYQLPVQLACTDTIILGVRGVPLIEQLSLLDAVKARPLFVWNGNRNHYENVDIFWAIRSTAPETRPNLMNFDAWNSYWGPSRENQPTRGPLTWKTAESTDRPLHAVTAADYTLDIQAPDSTAFPQPGFQYDRLPQIPPETTPPKTAFPDSVGGRDAGGRNGSV